MHSVIPVAILWSNMDDEALQSLKDALTRAEGVEATLALIASGKTLGDAAHGRSTAFQQARDLETVFDVLQDEAMQLLHQVGKQDMDDPEDKNGDLPGRLDIKFLDWETSLRLRMIRCLETMVAHNAVHRGDESARYAFMPKSEPQKGDHVSDWLVLGAAGYIKGRMAELDCESKRI